VPSIQSLLSGPTVTRVVSWAPAMFEPMSAKIAIVVMCALVIVLSPISMSNTPVGASSIELL
jgi:hypothetical protein